MTKTTHTPSNIHIHQRCIKHNFDDSIPLHWANNNPVITAFFNALSTVIPTGEKFFIRTVEETSATIENTALKKELTGFIEQETQHRVAHLAMNEWIHSKGIPINKITPGVENLLGFIEKHFSAKCQLALTVALEHFSCLLSDQFLRQKGIQANLHPIMRNFLVAHCVEENEHKAVAFDVYQAAYGSYLSRVAMMLFVTLIFAPNVFRIQFIYLWHEKQLFNVKAWLGAIGFFWFKPAWFTRTILGYLAYYKPRFHPWQHDNSALINAYVNDDVFLSSHHTSP
jgi:hypothetical protein